MTNPTIPELVQAVRAELSDLLDAVNDSEGNTFSTGGRAALKHMQRTQALLKLIEEKASE